MAQALEGAVSPLRENVSTGAFPTPLDSFPKAAESQASWANHLNKPHERAVFLWRCSTSSILLLGTAFLSFRDGSRVSCHMDPHRWLNYTIPSQAKLGNRRLERSHSKLGVTFFLCLAMFNFRYPPSFVTKHFSFSFLCKRHQLIAFTEHSHDSNSLSNLWTRENTLLFHPLLPSFLTVNFVCLSRRPYFL